MEGTSVVGVDPASRRVACFSVTSEGAFESLLEWSAPKSLSADSRSLVLHEAEKRLEGFFSRVPNGFYLFVESPLVGRGGARSTIVQSQMQGVILATGQRLGAIGVYEVNVQTWKKVCVGSGRADKGEVADWLSKAHPELSRLATSQDLVDAAAIATYGREVVRRSSIVSG